MRGVLLCGAAALALAGAGGCGHARYVHRDANGGVVAMHGNTEANRTKALKLIEEHVGAGYQIVEEKEVVTGQETTNHANTRKELTTHSQIPILPAEERTTVTTTTTRDVTEYHIVYRRGGAPAPGVPLVNGVPVTNPVQPAAAQLPAQPKK